MYVGEAGTLRPPISAPTTLREKGRPKCKDQIYLYRCKSKIFAALTSKHQNPTKQAIVKYDYIKEDGTIGPS